jgi:hypothetical protein
VQGSPRNVAATVPLAISQPKQSVNHHSLDGPAHRSIALDAMGSRIPLVAGMKLGGLKANPLARSSSHEIMSIPFALADLLMHRHAITLMGVCMDTRWI